MAVSRRAAVLTAAATVFLLAAPTASATTASAATSYEPDPVPVATAASPAPNSAGTKTLNRATTVILVSSSRYAQSTGLIVKLCRNPNSPNGDLIRDRAAAFLKSADMAANKARDLASRARIEHALAAAVGDMPGDVPVDSSRWLRAVKRWEAADTKNEAMAAKATEAFRACLTIDRPTPVR